MPLGLFLIWMYMCSIYSLWLGKLQNRIRWFHYLLKSVAPQDRYKILLYTIVRRVYKLTGRVLIADIDITIEDKKLWLKPVLGDLVFVYEIWYSRVYERLPNFCMKEGYNCLDIGASIGSVCLRWAAHNKSGRIIAVEPHPETFHRLKRNCESNNMHNIECVNAAIGSESGKGFIKTYKNSSLSRILEKPEDGETSVNCRILSIDDLVRWKSIDHVDIMKIDVEGYEVECLKGAKRTMDVTSRIIIEYHNDRLRDEAISILTRSQFTVKDMRNDKLSLIYAEKLSLII